MHVIINGREARYSEVVAKPGGYLLLRDGTRFTFDVIELFDFHPPKTTNPLIEVESLAYGNGKWMLRDQSLAECLSRVFTQARADLNKARDERQLPHVRLGKFSCNVVDEPGFGCPKMSEPEQALVRETNSKFFPPSYCRRWQLMKYLKLRKDNTTLQRDVCAVAWFEGSSTPVLLRDFSEIKSQQPAPQISLPSTPTPARVCSLAQHHSTSQTASLSSVAVWRFGPAGLFHMRL